MYHVDPLLQIDFYKADHRSQYPAGTTEVYANFTPRYAHLSTLKDAENPAVVFFGLQHFVMDFLVEHFQVGFFGLDRDVVVDSYQDMMDKTLGKGAIDASHIGALHDLGYLPIRIKGLPEGTMCPIGVPCMTIVNTHPDFFWLTNYLESVISNYLWKPMTSATTAFQFKRLLTKAAIDTGAPLDGVMFQAHDFSFRGMSGLQDAAMSGAAHLTSFFGTDSVSAVDFIDQYYDGYSADFVGGSVPATEHSVMCMGMEDGELATFRRLINDIYPAGIVSIVSDTWDFWKVITEYTVELKDEIMARDGKVVIRPDSGDPVLILCGDPKANRGSPEYKGAVQCLYEVFGGKINGKGYKELDSHIGLIYGDSITIERATEIISRLKAKGFASNNVVFGVGSFTYEYVTRDTFGFAMKATSGVVNGERRDIFKKPKTGSGSKASAKGLLRVDYDENGNIALFQDQTVEQEKQGLLETVFEDGNFSLTNINEIRHRIATNLDDLVSK